MSSKDTAVTFRVSSDSEQQLESIAKELEQSVARICEAFLKTGVALYKTGGASHKKKGYRGTLHREDICAINCPSNQ